MVSHLDCNECVCVHSGAVTGQGVAWGDACPLNHILTRKIDKLDNAFICLSVCLSTLVKLLLLQSLMDTGETWSQYSPSIKGHLGCPCNWGQRSTRDQIRPFCGKIQNASSPTD